MDNFVSARPQEYHGYGFKFTNDYFFQFMSSPEMGIIDVPDITEVNPAVIQCISMIRKIVRTPELWDSLDIIEKDLLQVKAEKRLSSRELVQRFEERKLVTADALKADEIVSA